MDGDFGFGIFVGAALMVVAAIFVSIPVWDNGYKWGQVNYIEGKIAYQRVKGNDGHVYYIKLETK